jgi:hypothetical protein
MILFKKKYCMFARALFTRNFSCFLAHNSTKYNWYTTEPSSQQIAARANSQRPSCSVGTRQFSIMTLMYSLCSIKECNFLST